MLEWALTVHGIPIRCSTYDPRQNSRSILTKQSIQTISNYYQTTFVIKKSENTTPDKHDKSTYLKELSE